MKLREPALLEQFGISTTSHAVKGIARRECGERCDDNQPLGNGCQASAIDCYQAVTSALLSISCVVLPLMAICRGFIASGISRASSMSSRPLLSDAPVTFT